MVAEDIQTHMLGTYRSLRRLIAVVTCSFLVTLVWYQLARLEPVERNSISAYYYHSNRGPLPMRDVYVGALTAVGLLLIAYQGYTDRESWALNAGGLSLLLVVLLPMDEPAAGAPAVGSVREGFHYFFAVLFFLAVAYVCLYRAHDTLAVMRDGGPKALFRNLYRVIGALLVAVPFVAIALYLLEIRSTVFLVECAGVGVFLAYWVVKSVELRLTRLETEAAVERVAATQPKEA